ncbi:MAG TPA: GRAS family protein [Longimicrobium sp.]|nr:GRAS family protein [Longimicrobium sp.]
MNSLKYATLLSVAQEAAAGREDNARALLARLVDEQLEGDAHGADLHAYLFATALSRRLRSDKTAELNLYLRQFRDTQISLFNLLAQHLPTVSLTAPLANELLARFVGGNEEVTLLDIGIGSGHQEVTMLRMLAQQGRLPRRLNVIAIEPDAGSLIESQMALFEATVEAGVELEFVPVHKVVEDVTDEEWAQFAAFECPLVVNASFAAHHIRCGEGEPLRDQVFRRIRELDPDAVVLSEPSSNHHAASLVTRFQNAYHHFGLTFRLIDQLEVTPQEAAAMKMFFAREIEDIVSNAEETRCERHEPVDAWVQRLSRAGFTPYADFDFARALRHPLVRVAPRDGYVALEYADEPLVAVICATAGALVRLETPAAVPDQLEEAVA